MPYTGLEPVLSFCHLSLSITKVRKKKLGCQASMVVVSQGRSMVMTLELSSKKFGIESANNAIDDGGC